MTEIIKSTKYFVFVNVNGRKFKIDNENVQEQLSFMEKIVPPVKPVFSFAQFFEPVPQLKS